MDATLGTVRCPLLIGRDDLLELVDRRIADVLDGRGQFLLISGEAGIGKTRFLHAVARKATEAGFAQVWGSVAPQDRDVPAASVLDLARTMLRLPAFADAGRDVLRLCAATVEAEHVTRRRLVMDVVERLLAGGPEPVLFVFEDLQWTDDLSLEVIAELARGSRDRPILLCGDYRTDEAPVGTSLRDWRARLLTQRIAEELRLTPLSAEDTALVTTLILDTGLPAPRDVAAAVYDRTDGIPLHIEELLGALSADARANGVAIREATVPDTIEDAVMSRLSHRSPEAQAVARTGAIIGRCFVTDVLAGIMDVPADSIDAPLQELVDHAVLWPPGDRGLYDFRHQLLRDAIYRSVPPSDRRRYHARAGEFGAQLEGQSEVHSSVHFERAGLGRRAFESALAGARDAARLSAHREAYALYRRAVDHIPDDLPAADCARILEAYGEQASDIEENEVAEAALTQAEARYREVGDPLGVARARSGIFVAWARAGRPLSERTPAIRAALDELATLPPGPGLDETVAWIKIDLASALIDGLEGAKAKATIDDYIRLYDGLGDTAGASDGAYRRAMVDVLDGDIDRGLREMARVARAARIDGEESLGVTAYREAAMWAARSMRYGLAIEYLGEGRRYADEIEQSHCAHLMQATSAMVAWAGSDWTGAVLEARQAISDRGCRRATNIARCTVGFVALGRGDLGEAEVALAESLAFGERSELVAYTLPPIWGLAEAALQAGDAERARSLCRRALEVARTGERLLFVPFVVTGTRAILATDRPDVAGAWVDSCADHLDAVMEVAAPAIAHARGLVALADGSTGVARSALEEAVHGWDALGRTWEGAWARLDLATCGVRTNRFAEAVGLAGEVRALGDRIGSRPLAERAESIQRQARGRGALDEPWRPLTAREFAVARLVAEGRTNVEIADTLGIAAKTASSHVEHILAKLGASRRAEIATWATGVNRSPAPH